MKTTLSFIFFARSTTSGRTFSASGEPSSSPTTLFNYDFFRSSVRDETFDWQSVKRPRNSVQVPLAAMRLFSQNYVDVATPFGIGQQFNRIGIDYLKEIHGNRQPFSEKARVG